MVSPSGLLVGFILSGLALAASSGCTASNAIVRKEYGSLTSAEKLAFISAVKCVMDKPSLLHESVPATTNKFDDYAAVHINMTTSIHFDGVFFSWHRHFVYLMEQELHSCGWAPTLGMPYWNWTLWPDLETSPMFDGSETSLGGNGAYDPVPNGTYTADNGEVVLPGGSGGGCVTEGPFANHTIYFQPLGFSFVYTGLPDNWTEPDPQCLKRDLNDYGARTFNNMSDIEFLLAQESVGDFNTDASGYGDSPGIHGGGHYMMGGTGYDFFGSPQEPAFYLHHAMLDNVWNVWQSADPTSRRYVYNGTSTIFNGDETPEVVNSTTLSYSVLGESTAEAVQDPMAGLYCYIYV